MDTFTDYNGYYVVLIIITIVTIAISIALSFYFIFIPFIRIENEFDVIQAKGLQAIQNVNNLISTSTTLSQEVLQETCDSVIYIANTLFGSVTPPDPDKFGCILDLFPIDNNPLIPSICDPFIPPI